MTNQTLDSAVGAILQGLDSLLVELKETFVTKKDLEQFATKEDLKQFATRSINISQLKYSRVIFG